MWFEPISAWLVSLISVGVPWTKEKMTKATPAENWANKELMHKDRMNGMSEKEILRNVDLGRYYIPKEVFAAYPVPHREPDGNRRIMIENCELHRNDIKQYGAYQAYKWVEQGKYNLNEEELKITHLQYEKKNLELITSGTYRGYEKEKARIDEIESILVTIPWDCRKTEAVLQWQKAHDAESKYYK